MILLGHPRWNSSGLNSQYGRMLKSKTLSIGITGIPEEYWIQMQIQMETCDLSCCDFLETPSKYDSEVL